MKCKFLILLSIFLIPILCKSDETIGDLKNFTVRPTFKGSPIVDVQMLNDALRDTGVKYAMWTNNIGNKSYTNNGFILQSGKGITFSYDVNGSVIIGINTSDLIPIITNNVPTKPSVINTIDKYVYVDTGFNIQSGKGITLTKDLNGSIIISNIISDNIEVDNKVTYASMLVMLDEINKLRTRVNLPTNTVQDLIYSINIKKDNLK